MSLIEGKTGPWETVIGLEIHAQVISKAKLFSGASAAFGAEPNSQVSHVDAAMPGMLPVINRFCVEQAVRTGLGLNARINFTSVFDRKNYFYPDLPAGYQISQYSRPIVGTGEVTIELADGSVRRVGITRLHLEQDAGKSLHDQHPKLTYVDLNRSGVALMEIVSEPDLRTAEEAGAYIRKVRSILRYLGTCDGNMEEGSLRCDANVSVRRPGAPYGTRAEIKNVNSVRFLQQAIVYEARRQVELVEGGGSVAQETRLFDSKRGVTRPMRSKEYAHDYRYFPDPDLLPLVLDPTWVERLRADLPELPDAKRERFMGAFGLGAYEAGVLVAERESAAYFEQAVDGAAARGRDPKLIANWVIGELFGRLNKLGKPIQESPVAPDALCELVDLVANGTISGRTAKDVFDEMFQSGRRAGEIVASKGLVQISDEGALAAAAAKVVAENADKVAQYKAGKTGLMGWFVGQVMKATGGKANPKLVNELLKKQIDT
ncbi:MAG: Asp-tRNA(Asn)/Glu-tRNA(Gln) amidotransferase subunit GatB [Alphaproteobacteria bacterium]